VVKKVIKKLVARPRDDAGAPPDKPKPSESANAAPTAAKAGEQSAHPSTVTTNEAQQTDGN
jgi:hypothetical protein